MLNKVWSRIRKWLPLCTTKTYTPVGGMQRCNKITNLNETLCAEHKDFWRRTLNYGK